MFTADMFTALTSNFYAAASAQELHWVDNALEDTAGPVGEMTAQVVLAYCWTKANDTLPDHLACGTGTFSLAHEYLTGSPKLLALGLPPGLLEDTEAIQESLKAPVDPARLHAIIVEVLSGSFDGGFFCVPAGEMGTSFVHHDMVMRERFWHSLSNHPLGDTVATRVADRVTLP